MTLFRQNPPCLFGKCEGRNSVDQFTESLAGLYPVPDLPLPVPLEVAYPSPCRPEWTRRKAKQYLKRVIPWP